MAVSSTAAHDRAPDQFAQAGPVRTCIGCRERGPATELLRVVADGATAAAVVPDPRRRAPGRGAWLHRDPRCVDLAERRRAFGRALRVQGPLDPAPVREYVESLGQQAPTSGTPQE
jgi:hypothetical protein